MGVGVRRGALLACLAVVLGLVTADAIRPGSAPDPYAALRGLLVDPSGPVIVDVVGDQPLRVPASAPAYRVRPPQVADLRTLAERHADRPVGPGLPGGTDPDQTTGFDTGDGWFSVPTEALEREAYDADLRWSWTEAASSAPSADASGSVPCPAGYPPEAASVVEFFADLGVDVLPKPWQYECFGTGVLVRLQPYLDGLPLVGVEVAATLDPNGRVVAAGGPLWRLEPAGSVPLAPAAEVRRRLVQGPGLVDGDCYAACTPSTDGAQVGLAFVTNGGIVSYDHTPGGIVDRPPTQLLVPAIWLPAMTPSFQGTHLGVLAVSSAALLDDAGQAELARQADAAPIAADDRPGCVQAPESSLTACVSRRTVPAGTPVVVTVYGERYVPTHAEGCDPLLSVDAGGGPRSFVSRSGTLVNARIVHVYGDPGIYTVQARAASRCAVPGSGGGDVPEYDDTAEITVTVT